MCSFYHRIVVFEKCLNCRKCSVKKISHYHSLPHRVVIWNNEGIKIKPVSDNQMQGGTSDLKSKLEKNASEENW